RRRRAAPCRPRRPAGCGAGAEGADGVEAQPLAGEADLPALAGLAVEHLHLAGDVDPPAHQADGLGWVGSSSASSVYSTPMALRSPFRMPWPTSFARYCL